MKEQINVYINRILPELISLRREIHRNPELSNKEIQTSKLIQQKLIANGIEAITIKANTGVTALIQGGQEGDTIAYRADLDALPMEEKTGLLFASQNENVMHACGHDIHTTVLYGTALVINKFKDYLKGNLRIIFQSGEENFTGAKEAIESGILETPQVKSILALHTWPDLPAGTIGLKKGPMMASSSNLSFKITGKGGHAAHPHRGIDPIVVSSYIITAIQSIVSRNIPPIDSAVISFGKLTAGNTSNIIPDYAIGEGTVRTLSPSINKIIEEKIKSLIEYQAESFGAKAEIKYENISPPVINDSNIIDVLEESSYSSIGYENIRWLDSSSMGSEDFAFYLEKIPGALIRLGTHNDTEESKLPLHNSKIIFDERSIETGVKFMSNAIISLLNNSKI
ncbi:M20 metallopeptidase family protein [Clostridium sp. Cult1]|uniref:M20 metallopeptidase family protein n=1 Tax=Clostridium sp. Cult1 TaxID=2079002 RepID=UPI001F3D31E0|nr:M20 family metallopeptidase [Clostridium sp. Cult1]